MRLTLFATLVLAPTLGYADTQRRTTDAQKMHTDDCALAHKQNKPCVLNFDKETIDGTMPNASGTTVGVITISKQPSLIRIRRDFIVEVLKTAEDL